MRSFLEEVVEKIRYSEDINDTTTFVLPSKRAGTFLRNCIAQTADKTTFSPKIYSIEAFVEEISGLSKASGTELLFLLYQTYLDVTPGEKDEFYDFSKWAQVLLQDFNEVDRYLIAPDQIFNYLSAIKEVNHWYLKPEKTELMQNYIAFWDSLEVLYSTFRDRLISKKLGHQGLIYRQASLKIKEYIGGLSSDQRVFFIGFNALNTAESYIIQEMLSSTDADIFWDTDSYFLEDQVHDAGHFIRQHRQDWPYLIQHGVKGVGKNYTSQKNINIIGSPKNISQVKYVGGLLSELQRQNPDSLKKTAIVLGDEGLMNPLINSIPKEINRINITMGYPLYKTPVADMFSQFFELYINRSKRGWFHKNVFSFLAHNYIQLLFSTEKPQSLFLLQEAIAEKNLSYLNTTILSSFGHFPADLLSLIFFDEELEVKGFIKRCLALIEGLKTVFQASNSSLELEYLYHFYTLFNRLLELTELYPFVKDLKSLYRLYRELLSSETIDFHGEPLGGLQLMGMLESRNLDFETVILTSVNEGILPGGKTNNSFIPFDVKKEFGLPTYKEKDAVYTYHFYRLLQRAKNVYLLYNTEPDVLEGGEKSRLITQLLTDDIEGREIKEVIASPKIEPILPQLKRISKNKDVLRQLEARAARGFSPTSLTTYIRNPIDFYKAEILNIREYKELEETIAANTFGTVIHNSLETLYSPFVGSFLSEEILTGLKPKISSVVQEHFGKSFSKEALGGKNLIAFNVIKRYLENFLNMEIEEVAKHRIRLLALEVPLKIELKITGLEFPIVLKGTLDRVEERDGRIRIIDYKTGKVNRSMLEIHDWDLLISDYEYSKAFQLLCYALMYQEQHQLAEIEAGVISFKNLGAGFLPFATKEKRTSRNKATGIGKPVLDQFRTKLSFLIQEICNADIPFLEKEL